MEVPDEGDEEVHVLEASDNRVGGRVPGSGGGGGSSETVLAKTSAI